MVSVVEWGSHLGGGALVAYGDKHRPVLHRMLQDMRAGRLQGVAC